jgi:hypothetical protein
VESRFCELIVPALASIHFRYSGAEESPGLQSQNDCAGFIVDITSGLSTSVAAPLATGPKLVELMPRHELKGNENRVNWGANVKETVESRTISPVI